MYSSSHPHVYILSTPPRIVMSVSYVLLLASSCQCLCTPPRIVMSVSYILLLSSSCQCLMYSSCHGSVLILLAFLPTSLLKQPCVLLSVDALSSLSCSHACVSCPSLAHVPVFAFCVLTCLCFQPFSRPRACVAICVLSCLGSFSLLSPTCLC